MLPITNLLSCTEPIDEFESLSPEQHHAKTYTTGLVAASNKTVAGIGREVLPAQGKRAVNEFLTKYDWDEDQVNHERIEELQKHGETRWSQDGYIILDDSVTDKTGKELPGVGKFYDHAEGETVGDRISSTLSTLTTKPPTHSPFGSTMMTTTAQSTTLPERSSRNSKTR
jgi:hypothetical protein